jgi:hypothetical protein
MKASLLTVAKIAGIAVGSTAAAAFVGMYAWRSIRRWRRKSPEEMERLRRIGVNARGRIIPGRIVELAEPATDGASGPILLYSYEVAGVTYEAAQDLSALPHIAAAAPFLPGQTASVKYDPKVPTNSILACETWSGIPVLERTHASEPALAKEPAESRDRTGKTFPIA